MKGKTPKQLDLHQGFMQIYSNGTVPCKNSSAREVLPR